MRSILFMVILFVSGLAAAQTPSLTDLPKPDPAKSVTVNTRIARNISAKRAKIGDSVEFNLEDAVTLTVGDKQVTIPKKAKMTGKIYAANKHDKTKVSIVGFAVDQITWKDGSLAVRALPSNFDQKDAIERRVKACAEAGNAMNFNRYGNGDPQSEHCRAVAQTHPLILDPNASTFALAEDDVQLDSGLIVTFLLDANPAAAKQDAASK